MTNAQIFATGAIAWAGVWAALAHHMLGRDRDAFYGRLIISQMWLVAAFVVAAVTS